MDSDREPSSCVTDSFSYGSDQECNSRSMTEYSFSSSQECSSRNMTDDSFKHKYDRESSSCVTDSSNHVHEADHECSSGSTSDSLKQELSSGSSTDTAEEFEDFLQNQTGAQWKTCVNREDTDLGEVNEIIISRSLRLLKWSMSCGDTYNPNVTLANYPEEYGNITEVRVARRSRNYVMKKIRKMSRQLCKSGNKKLEFLSRRYAHILYSPELNWYVLTKHTMNRKPHTDTYNVTTALLGEIYNLCKKDDTSSVRAIYYDNPKRYKSTERVKRALNDIACSIGCTIESLRIDQPPEGLLLGPLSFLYEGNLIKCDGFLSGHATCIPKDYRNIRQIQSTARFIFVVEKFAVFQRLAKGRFHERIPCIILTGFGESDVATRVFLKTIQQKLQLPVLTMVDCDPSGFRIFSVHKYGSKEMSHANALMCTQDMKWLGFKPSDVTKNNIPQQKLKDFFTEEDDHKKHEKMLTSLLKEDFVKENEYYVERLEKMKEVKAEIEVLNVLGRDYLFEYVLLQIQNSDWEP